VAEVELDAVVARPVPRASELSRFPQVRRDLALVVREEVRFADVDAVVRAAAGALLRGAVLFDVYRGPAIEAGCKSFAIGLIFQTDSRTLGDAEVDRLVAAVAARAAAELGARIRA
jgi:phenylalanyl-tRNA synthetase beta chain